MVRAMVMESMAPQGPTAMAIRTPPTACPVVPPGRGMLNIITRKPNAAEIASSGVRRADSFSRNRRAAIAHSGAQAAYAARYVGGPRYPSGMCIPTLPACHPAVGGIPDATNSPFVLPGTPKKSRRG
jgi:hypothetical protein